MGQPKDKLLNWAIFFILAFIWGSSFILMKEGMKALSPYQVAALRMLSGGIVLLPVAVRQFRNIPVNKIRFIFLSSLLGSFFPAFLFCIAETKIDSSLASFLNSLTPVFTALIGIMFFKSIIEQKKVIGIAIAFIGMIVLFLAGESINATYISYSLFVLLAVVSYALNINLVGQFLKSISPTNIAAVGFAFLVPPSILILIFTGYFNLPLSENSVLISTAASVTLGVMGTAVATILFYIMLKRAGTLFSSMVTYGIPFVALFWGILAGESMNALQVGGLAIILAGVYIANSKVKIQKSKAETA